MAGYLFYPRADAAQDRIWSDTLEIWGEAAAIDYITGLHHHLTKLSTTKAIWRRLPAGSAFTDEMREKVFFSRYKSHFIFFRPLSGERIGVMSILHERMDVPARLHKDLAQFPERQSDKPE